MLYTAAKLCGKRLKLSMLVKAIQMFIHDGLICNTLHRLFNDAFALTARCMPLILILIVNCVFVRFEVLEAVCVLRRVFIKNSKASILLTVIRVEGSFLDYILCHIVRLVHLLLVVLGLAFLCSFIWLFLTDKVCINAVLFFHCKIIPGHYTCRELVESTHCFRSYRS